MAMSAERKAERAADRKRAKVLTGLKSIAREVEVLGDCGETNAEFLRVTVDGVAVEGKIEAFNVAIEKLGYRPVRVTSNMLNEQAGEFCIDADTPAYMDPGCESYHSM